MSWNYRVVKSTESHPNFRNGEPYEVYAIHEIYYDENGVVNGHVEKPEIGPYEELGELLPTLKRLAEALDKPIILVNELPGNSEPGLGIHVLNEESSDE